MVFFTLANEHIKVFPYEMHTQVHCFSFYNKMINYTTILCIGVPNMTKNACLRGDPGFVCVSCDNWFTDSCTLPIYAGPRLHGKVSFWYSSWANVHNQQCPLYVCRSIHCVWLYLYRWKNVILMKNYSTIWTRFLDIIQDQEKSTLTTLHNFSCVAWEFA